MLYVMGGGGLGRRKAESIITIFNSFSLVFPQFWVFTQFFLGLNLFYPIFGEKPKLRALRILPANPVSGTGIQCNDQ